MRISIKRLFTKKRLLITVIVLAVGLITAFAFGVFDKDVKVTKKESEKKYYSKLTGMEVKEDVSKRPILAVMIENSEEARPQNGLDSAGIVFEALTEGGITRYLLLFQEDGPETIGPIRSIRPHFLNWLMGFDASVAHAGGSAEALDLVSSRNARSMSEFTNPDTYFRDNSREAPHDLYAHDKDLRKLQEETKHKESKFDEILRSNESPAQQPTNTVVAIDYSSPEFKVEFRYDQPTNSYIRFLAGQPHIDKANNKQISVKNLIITRTAGQEALGSGEALIFKNGAVIKGSWRQADFNSRIKFFDQNSNEISLNRGDTWVSAVPTDRTVTY